MLTILYLMTSGCSHLKANETVMQEMSFQYLSLIEALPSVNLYKDDKHPIDNINWSWVATQMVKNGETTKTKRVVKRELVENYVRQGKVFKYPIFVNTKDYCRTCHKGIPDPYLLYVISTKKGLMIEATGKELHLVAKHDAAFSSEKLEKLRLILDL